MSSPRERIEAECLRIGLVPFVHGCMVMLRGAVPDPGLVAVLGGTSQPSVQADSDRDDRYWLRVWAARGLLWAWHDDALPAVVAAFDDEAWRVREMAAKVVARHRLDAALEGVLRLQEDPVARVRTAAERAVRQLVLDSAHGAGG